MFKFRFSASTLLLLLAIAGFVLPRWIAEPIQLRTFLTFAVWPICSLASSIWAVVNLIRFRLAQFGLEAIVALCLVWVFCDAVFLSPN